MSLFAEQPLGLAKVRQQPLARRAFAVLQPRLDLLVQMEKVALQQRHAKRLFRAKIVVAGALRHLPQRQQFAESHSGETALQTELLAGGEQMFTGFGALLRLVHGA